MIEELIINQPEPKKIQSNNPNVAVQRAPGTLSRTDATAALEKFLKSLKDNSRAFKAVDDVMQLNINVGNTERKVYDLFKACASKIRRDNLIHLIEKCLDKQIMQYIPDKCDAKNIALDIITKCTKKEGNVNWLVKGYKFLTIEDLDADGSTRLSGYHENFNVNLDSKNSETLSITKKIATIFKSKMVCGAVVIASVINLGFSIIAYLEISELTKTI